jgi:hypothetical protein
MCPLAVTCDARPCHPPFFDEFCYTDIQNGLMLRTLSSELNARSMMYASNQEAREAFPIEKVIDKYALGDNGRKYRRVIFLPGNNSVSFIDQNRMAQLMATGDWFIKPHPVCIPEMVKDLARVYGYSRIIEPNVSGHRLLVDAQEIATTAASEMYLMARLMDKPVLNVGAFVNQHLMSYDSIVRLLTNRDTDKAIINRCLMSDSSGYIRPEWPLELNQKIIANYIDFVMHEREKFRMVTQQRLVADTFEVRSWQGKV